MLNTRHNTVDIAVDAQHIAGTLVASSMTVPGVLLVHGWDGNQENAAPIRSPHWAACV